MNNYLIIINSSSGTGESEQIYLDYLLPKLEIMNINFTVQKDDASLDLIDLCGINYIIIVGGDGTIVPVISLLYCNNYNIPICQIPAGSGNGLCKSILFELGEEYSINNAVSLINSFNDKKINLFDVFLKKNR